MTCSTQHSRVLVRRIVISGQNFRCKRWVAPGADDSGDDSGDEVERREEGKDEEEEDELGSQDSPVSRYIVSAMVLLRLTQIPDGRSRAVSRSRGGAFC